MKITDVSTYIAGNPWKNWVFVRVDTDSGLHGIGEATVNGFARTAETAIHELKRLVIGEDPFDVEMHTLRLFRDVYTDGGQIHGAALAGLEFACWDIMGKALGQPVFKLIGGRCHPRLRAYANGWYRGPREPQSFHDKAKVVVARGYTALKFDPFGAAWRSVDQEDFALALDIIAAVREAVGPTVDILVESHNRFSPHTALQFADAMAVYQPTWFETPVPPQRIAQMVTVARRSPVRVFAFRPLGHDADLGLTLAVGLSRDEVLAEFDTRVLRYGSVIVALTLLTLMLAYVTGIQLVLRPVDTLARGLRRLREGDLEARVHMGAVRSDLGALGQDFNAMAAAMEVRKAERREADTRLRQSEERYRALFTHGGVCAAVFDDEGRFVEANDACAEMLGYAPGALAGVSLWDVTPEADRASRQAEWQSRGQAGAYIFRRRDGGLAHVDYQAAVNVMPGHHLWMMRDVTQQLRIDLYNRVLAEASLALQASLDQGGPLQGLLGAIVPALADWAVAHLATPAGDVALEGAAHIDEAQLPRLTEAAQEHPPRADAAASAGPARVLATGKLEHHPQLDPDASAGEEPAWPPLRALGAASLIVTPLVARGRTLGALTLALTGHTRRFAPTDAALAQELGRRAALALDNARLFDEAQALNVQLEQRVAARTQQLRQSLEEVHASREALRQLSRRLQSAREAERRHIASEIHDELGGALTGLKIDAVSLRNGLTPDQTALTAKAQAMTALIDSTIQIVRRLATELRPSMLDDLGLVAALEWLAQDFGERTGLEVQFESNVEQLDLDPDSAIAVYRTAQESLTNVARHAETARVDLRLTHDGQTLHLLVADDGRGITPDEIGRLGSLGLVGMRERIASVAGELTIDSTLGKGTRISACLPLPPAANPAPSD